MDPSTNLTTIRCDSLEIWDPVTRAHADVMATVIGIAPADLNNIGLLADALGGDPDYFNTTAATIARRRERHDGFPGP